jgi:hypothetical protein
VTDKIFIDFSAHHTVLHPFLMPSLLLAAAEKAFPLQLCQFHHASHSLQALVETKFQGLIVLARD